MAPTFIAIVLAVGIVLTAAVFGADPGLDLTVAAAFYRGAGAFTGQDHWGELLRRSLYYGPTAVAVLFILLYAARRAEIERFWSPGGRSLLVVFLSFALGPGVLTNVVLKDHSHRPRPYQTVEFGGTEPFRPFYRFDGACARNCSFVSGEGSAAFWTTIPALMVPPPWQPVAVAASVLFGLAVATLRIAAGAHYLSDTIFAALFTWTVGWLLWRFVPGGRAPNDPVGREGLEPPTRPL